MGSQLLGAIADSALCLLTSMLTLFVRRHLRKRGELCCDISARLGSTASADYENRHFEVKFFNEKGPRRSGKGEELAGALE
jgi:hypothetical protein